MPISHTNFNHLLLLNELWFHYWAILLCTIIFSSFSDFLMTLERPYPQALLFWVSERECNYNVT